MHAEALFRSVRAEPDVSKHVTVARLAVRGWKGSGAQRGFAHVQTVGVIVNLPALVKKTYP